VPGDALIRLYGRVGPLLAAAIEDSPPARFAVRAAMIPLAGAALLLLYHPVLPVLALIVSWCGARFLCRRLRRKPRPGLQSPAGQRGAILLTLIAMMVIFSALGAYMISMFGSSSLGLGCRKQHHAGIFTWPNRGSVTRRVCTSMQQMRAPARP
jgi:hypothetical protein